MAVREGNGDATEFRSIPWATGNKSFSDMSEQELRSCIERGAAWQNGTPKDFDPWNSWGGHYAAEQTDKANAKNASAELARRTKKT